ncbi:hypothetical protein BDW59DRAFT_153969 [Aspergillus cavernicola]|uniref:Uncharacterized protein n=1 Tax=Aspergillus cavernicola TaxID=176166 RepID=A0ABR4HKC9_9EURO
MSYGVTIALSGSMDGRNWGGMGNLRSGFNHLFWRLKFAPKESKGNTKALLWDMRSMLDKDHLKITRSDVALLRQRRGQWLELYPQLRENNDMGELWFYPDRWFMDWVNYYDQSEALWFWLKGCKDEIHEEGKADVLVDWVLSRDEVSQS